MEVLSIMMLGKSTFPFTRSPAWDVDGLYVCVYVYVYVYVYVCVCVCEREREKERERVCVYVCVCVSLCVCEREMLMYDSVINIILEKFATRVFEPNIHYIQRGMPEAFIMDRERAQMHVH